MHRSHRKVRSHMTDFPIPEPYTGPGSHRLVVGLILPLVGVLGFMGLMSAGGLNIPPYYMPAFALLGALVIARSLWERRTTWRWLGLAAVLLLTGLETAFLAATSLPAYSGPVAVGQPFPAFESRRADGSKFTQDDLVGGQSTALVFFRGRW